MSADSRVHHLESERERLEMELREAREALERSSDASSVNESKAKRY